MAGSLRFKVLRMPAELVSPAVPTPRELKLLSDIDDQGGLRFHIPAIHLFRRRGDDDKDPVGVLRDAVARALVHYYLLAGRLRELEGRKLAVDCTGEGADADVRLDQFGDDLQPPFPCLEELMLAVPDGEPGVLDFPLVIFQVTRLACGGFIMTGLVQFLAAVAELARGASAPTVRPVWSRELLMARERDDDALPPRSFAHREYDEEIAAARSHLPPPLRHGATTFELLTGCLWSVRGRKNHHNGADAIPSGYYGNAFAFPVAVATAGELRGNPVGYAVELVRNAKREVAGIEYLRSLAGLMVRRGRPHFAVARAYLVSDVSRSGIRELDFGWGKPVYAGPAKGGVGAIPGVASFLIACRNNARGEEGIVVPVCLPGPAMDKFVQEMAKLMRPAAVVVVTRQQQQQPAGVVPAIKSAM
ncbi:hypothetical protein BRADI_4g37830v3 [Brachypodium distachyon]|uniref:Benzyl alcohol O-benzoyltransferase n=1 Tax=Brachypodium distachyon TaxID=15368 RepID=A0A0Q3EVE0_BRADI|nr:hypothetical protein BRADI_4g37830v3 [Brachypodium distachyon]